MGFPSTEKPWLRYYDDGVADLAVPEKTIYRALADAVAAHPDLDAIDYLGRKITYGGLLGRIDAAARAFARMGIGRGDVVSLITANTPENAVSIYALNKIGAVANMVDCTLKGWELAKKVEDAGSRAAVVTDLFAGNLAEALPGLDRSMVVSTSPGDSMPFLARTAYRMGAGRSAPRCGYVEWADFIRAGEGFRAGEVPYERDSVAAIMYTSGTTGVSKGAMFTNENLTAMAQEYRHCGMRFEEGERFFNENPPFLAYCVVLGINLPLSLGLCIDMKPDYRPDEFARRVYESRAPHVIACPADWSDFEHDGKARTRDYSFLSTLASGGVGYDPERKDRMNDLLLSLGAREKIVEGYGMTEGSSAMCTNTPRYNVLGTVGIPLPMMDVCVWDAERGCELPFGEVGELCFRGPTVMKGYLDPALDAETLQIHPDGLTWLHTGDLGSVRDDGGVEVVGRIKRLIVRYDGFKVSPFEVERAIAASGDISACCVVGIPDRDHGFGSVPVAFVVPAEGTDGIEAERAAADICRAQVSDRSLPTGYIAIDGLPLTKIGKVDYRRLEKMAGERCAASGGQGCGATGNPNVP